jgi:hypothetical protein
MSHIIINGILIPSSKPKAANGSQNKILSRKETIGSKKRFTLLLNALTVSCAKRRGDAKKSMHNVSVFLIYSYFLCKYTNNL